MIHEYSTEEAVVECANDCPEVIVTSVPPSGSQLNFPSYIILTAGDPRAVIHYTTDGTTPDGGSTEYTTPILVTSSGVVIRALGIIEGCTPGPVADIQFNNSQFPFVVGYECDQPDHAGQWDDFTTNGIADHHWTLQFTLPGATTIKRLELYQLDADGKWTTGQAWSTDSPINPAELEGADFEVFPLLLFIAAVQQHVAYQSSLGSFGAGSHTWDLYGDIVIAAGGLFRLDIILDDNTKLSQIIDADTCTATPPLCPPPDAPTVVAKCDGAVDVTFAGAVGQDYLIYAKTDTCGSEGWQEMGSGTIDASPKTVEVSGLTPGCLYEFYVSVSAVGCGFRDSAPSLGAIPKLEPVVTIATNKTIVDPNESFTISWTSNNIGGAVCGGCLDGEVSIDQSMGCKAGNAPGSQAQSQSVCGVYTYQITGCNTCGSAVASVQVEVRCAATCSGTQANCLKVVDVNSELCGEISAGTCGMNSSTFCGAGFWAGTMFNTEITPCAYTAIAQGLIGCNTDGCGFAFGGALCIFDDSILPARWRLQIRGRSFEGGGSGHVVMLWEGEKMVGTNATGIYTKTAGCATGPATLTTTSQNCPV